MRARVAVRAWLLALPLGVLPGGVVAQSPGVSGGVSRYHVTNNSSALRQELDGFGWAVRGAMSFRVLRARVTYGEASLDLEGTTTGSVLAEGEALAGVAVRPWITIWAGPHVRARETAGRTERWILWEARLDLSGDLVARRVGWSLETWGVASASADAPQPFERGLGTAGAVSLRLQRTIRAELSYRVEQARLGQGSRRETTDVLSLWLSWAPAGGR